MEGRVGRCYARSGWLSGSEGIYAGSKEELAPLKTDILGGLPLTLVIVNLLIDPLRGKRIASRAVARYSLTPASIQTIHYKM
jgi:hypothetical protein